jgi:hypothetical protein
MPHYKEITPITVTDATASGTFEIDGHFGNVDEMRLQLDVTAASGTTPTLDVDIQDTLDGTNYNTLASFTQAAGVTREPLNHTTIFGNKLRGNYTIAGTDTPTFTFTITGVLKDE